MGMNTNTNTDMTTNSTRRLTSSLTNIPNIMIVSLYVPTQSYTTINNSRRRRRREAKSVINCCTDLIVVPYSIQLIVELYIILYIYIRLSQQQQLQYEEVKGLGVGVSRRDNNNAKYSTVCVLCLHGYYTTCIPMDLIDWGDGGKKGDKH